jgi:hypothetical protein
VTEQPVIYDLGDTITLGAEIRDADGDLANAGAVVLTVILPDGTTITPLVTNPATGKYSAAFSATQVGHHVIKWTATGTNASAWRDSLEVRDDALIPPVSLDALKRYLSIAADTSDEELRAFLDTASQAGEAYTGRVFGRRTVVATFTRPSGAVTFPGVPILSVSSLVDDGDTISADNFLVWKASGVIEPTGAWQGDLTVTAVCGYPAPPAPIRQGILEMTRHLWQTQRGTIRMGVGADEWNPAMSFSLPRRVSELWDAYRIPGFG